MDYAYITMDMPMSPWICLCHHGYAYVTMEVCLLCMYRSKEEGYESVTVKVLDNTQMYNVARYRC